MEEQSTTAWTIALPLTIYTPTKCKNCGEDIDQVSNGIVVPRLCACRRKEQADYEARIDNDIQRKRKDRIEKLFKISEIGKRFQDRTFEKFIQDRDFEAYRRAKTYADNFKKNKEQGSGLIITGTVGNGKTHLAAAIANQLIAEHLETVIFSTVINILDKIKGCYNNYTKDIDSNDLEIIYHLKNCDLLILDDFGKEKMTGWAAERIYNIINSRYENLKPIVITTNFDLKALKNHIDSACFSRLMESCYTITMTAGDYRIERRKNLK